MLLDKITADIDYSGKEVAVMIKVHDYLTEKGIKIYKTFVGNYMTSIEMAGFSISLLRLDSELKELLDAKADTPAFKE